MVSSTEKALSAIGYLGFLFFIPLVCCKDSQYAKFHANQGLILFITSLIVTIVSRIFALIPIIGWLIALLLSIVSLVLFAFMILGIVNAATGKMNRLPLIGSLQLIK
ncbi:MAG TPA: DUF4870 domain-containing protein [Firmicutes bacterium]|nr:DUF4870 domain-containing protein [Bacillota bacterium]